MAGLYGLLAGAWILLSDRLISLLTDDPAHLTLLQTYKGWGFVLVTAILLYLILRREWFRLQGEIHARQLAEEELRQLNVDLAAQVMQAEREIDARQQAEKALRASEARLIEAQRLARVGDVSWDVETGEITWSEALLEMLGYDPAETIDYARVTEQIHHPDDRERVTRWLDDCIASGRDEIPPNEYRVLRKDGEVLFVRTICTIRQRPGQKPLIFATIQDITERALAEVALRKSEKKFRSLFQNHAAVQLIIDPKSGDIVDANEAAERFYGWPAEELRRMNIVRINIPPPATAQQEIEMARRMSTMHFEFKHRKADGTIADVEVLRSKVNIDGREYLHSIIHDITDRRQLENQLLQAQKMESVGRLAGGVAHDFNNMLGVILGNTEMALDKVEPSDPLYTDLRDIYFAAKKSADITRQLLAFARKQTMNPQVVDLNESVEGMLKILRRLIGEDIDLVWLPGSGAWPVMIDPSQLDQILANLCINARDAIGGVGKVTIETGNATFDAAYCFDHPDIAPGDFVLLAVSDDGSGMDQETLDHLFEPFFTTKEIGHGTGLGLATVYGIVRQNNGFINVSSEPDKGTTFKIYLPRHAGEAGLPEKTRETEIPRGKGETILLVEDDVSLLRLARRLLGGLGYTVLDAATPGRAEALALEHAGRVDLLLTDVVMPEMNGRELAGRLQALYPDLKVLYMSGYTADVIAHRGVLETGVHFIQKPFAKRALAEKIREVLDA
ncbi:MAG: hybrid sensor histidine kinase/response regulator [Desulfobulbaceae bacterium]